MTKEAIKIIDLSRDNATAIAETAEILFSSFKENAPNAWPTLAVAREEVLDSLAADRVSRIAIDPHGAVLGWIAGQSQYDGLVWELHPLVVRANVRGQGIGQMLVRDLERIVRERGGLTLWLGTDDENQQTSLGGIELYANLWEHVREIKNLRRHPYEFYQKMGFVITGVLPDANGYGKPDIFMAKRIT